MTGVLSGVLAAVADGAGSAGEVARRTGVPREVAETALATLGAAGRIRRVLVFAGGCADGGSAHGGWADGAPADGGCGGCASASGCASAGMGSLAGSGLTAWRIAER